MEFFLTAIIIYSIGIAVGRWTLRAFLRWRRGYDSAGREEGTEKALYKTMKQKTNNQQEDRT